MKVKVGIVGAAGYTGGELIRLLLNHPNAEIAFAHSNSSAGKYISAVHTDLIGETNLKFTNTLQSNIDTLFLCVGHGEAKKFLSENNILDNIKVIDLSQDFRIKTNGWIYGLPELNKEEIQSSKFHIANPGCFATCIQLALLPLAKAGLLTNDIHINATTGSTGAGQSLSATSHFSWRANNVSTYKVFEHQHLVEIGQSIQQLQNSFQHDIYFIPNRGNFTRGIFTTIYTDCDLSENDAVALFENYYQTHPFVSVSEKNIDLKQVVNTNKCLLHLKENNNKLIITSIIDNLLKGASGQAVQNMNLLFGLEETSGLKLKANYF